MGDGGGGQWLLVRMEWRPSRWSVCLPLLIFPCTIKSRSSLLTPSHLGGPGKTAVKWLWCGGVGDQIIVHPRPLLTAAHQMTKDKQWHSTEHLQTNIEGLENEFECFILFLNFV